MTNEAQRAAQLAHRLLNDTNADPDDDLRMLSRQLLRAMERDPLTDMIASNRDRILNMHRDAVRRVRQQLHLANVALTMEAMARHINIAELTLQALNTYHPVHEDTWKGWPADE